MLNGAPPYRALLTHGFVVDGDGRKMSKSLGNVIAPQKVVGTLGADILRLWVASTDYSGELSISDEILKRVVESYRRIRNTLRFLLANISDFDPTRDTLPPEHWLEIDRYALATLAALQSDVIREYEQFRFHLIAHRLHEYCSEHLGAFYLDILKDRLYTAGQHSRPRRAAQNVLFHITHTLLRLFSPILSFTADDAWPHLPDRPKESIFMQTWHELPPIADAPALLEHWGQVLTLRADVSKELEQLRVVGKIGSALAAEVELYVAGTAMGSAITRIGADLRFVFITSAVHVRQGTHADAVQSRIAGVGIRVVRSDGMKCERCWHYRHDLGDDPEHPQLCGRCVSNLFGEGEIRPYA
jgi:isoleucyl-tRNA synthetase